MDTSTEHTTTTEDGDTIAAGLRAFNYYDQKPGTVGTIGHDCWFTFTHDDGTEALLNGERVCTLAHAARMGWHIEPASTLSAADVDMIEAAHAAAPVYPNPVAAWCRSTTDTDQRAELVARVLTAAAELCAADVELVAALDDIAAEHRYLSRVWDRGMEAAEHFEKLADEWMETARVHLATATDDSTDPADRSHAVYLNGTAHARGSGFREAAHLARRAMEG